MTQDYSELLKWLDYSHQFPIVKKAATAIRALGAENEMLREALEKIAEESDAGRHDGLPEPCPAHDDLHMWLIARAALGETK